jgi:hypothetical protein
MSSTRTLVLGCLFVAAVNCGRSAVDSGDAGLDDAGNDAGTLPDGGTQPDGGPLWPVGAQRIRATQTGGFGNFGCRTDAGVTMFGSSWNLTWPAGELSFSVCQGSTFHDGQKVLTKAEADQFDLAMRGLTTSANSICGADKPDLRLLIDLPNGTLLYEDSFYGCLPKPGTVYVDHIDAVFNRLVQFSL